MSGSGARISGQAAGPLGSAGTGSVAGNPTTTLVALSESAALAVISLAIPRELPHAQIRQASRDLPLRETKAMIASYLDAERELDRIAADTDAGTLALALIAPAILLCAIHHGVPPEPEAIRKTITVVIQGSAPLPSR